MRCGEPSNARAPRLDRVRAGAERPTARAIAAATLSDVVRALEPDLRERVASLAQPIDRHCVGRGVDDHRRPAPKVTMRPSPRCACAARRRRLAGRPRRRSARLVDERVALGARVGVEARVAIEVIFGDVQERATRGWNVGDALHLEARHLEDDDVERLVRPRRRAARRGCRRRTLRLPARSSIAPTSAVVVLLPLVPPIATIGAVDRSATASSSSPITTHAAARALFAASGSGGTPGETTTRSAPLEDRGVVLPPSTSVARPAVTSARAALESFVFAAPRRCRSTSAPRAKQQTRRCDAAPAEPHHHHSLAVQFRSYGRHRSFSDDRLTSASRMEMIQKRTMIFGSGHPFFS